MLFLFKSLFVMDVLIAFGLMLFRWALAPAYRNIVTPKIAVLALLTPAVGLFCGNIYVFCAYLAAIVAFNSRSRTTLAGFFLFLLPLVPVLSFETGVGGVYLLAVSTVLAMGLGALIGFAVTPRRGTLTPTRYDVAVLAIAGIMIFINNHDPSATGLLRALTLVALSFLGPYLLVSRALRTTRDVERLLLHLLLGGTVTAVTALFQARWHWVVFQSYYEALRVPFPITSFTLALRAGLLRTGGSMVDYSAGGLFLASMLTLAVVLRSYFRSAGFWIVVALLVGGLIATQSRGAWVAALIGIVFVFAFQGAWWKTIAIAGTAIVAEAAVLLFATSGRLAAIVGQGGEAAGTVSYRRDLAVQGLEQIRLHPLLGQSQKQLIASMPDMVQGEHIVDFVNAHLFMAMTAGVPLFLVWCWVWLMPVIEAWRARRKLADDNLVLAPAAIMVPAMIALTFTSIIDRNLTWPTIALALAGPCLVLARRSRGAARRPLRSSAQGTGPETGPRRAAPAGSVIRVGTAST